ncbi:hypothetical protein EVAR_55210_1 [Eumeta japonica]|uniref:Uncharacterized protein n=1 Tax=Eumeta variegata TaxID=151549 RepID=A0A4C1ZQB0_EUMVA|nr:hypothetical protein EVAR_55210_1 [Eumeta japonica]
MVAICLYRDALRARSSVFGILSACIVMHCTLVAPSSEYYLPVSVMNYALIAPPLEHDGGCVPGYWDTLHARSSVVGVRLRHYSLYNHLCLIEEWLYLFKG